MKRLMDVKRLTPAFALLVILLLAAPGAALAKMNVFACEPEWAALAGEIGGGKLEIFSATHAEQNPHYIRARPSLISKIRRADVVICSGASLEVGWLPLLVRKAGGNAQPGKAGYLMAADFVETLEKPEYLDRSMGDIHPEGNPHVQLDPRNILVVADELASRLAVLDRENAEVYGENLRNFSGKWKEAIRRWETEAAPLRGKYVVSHHQTWIYLLDWLGIRRAGTLEEKPGIPPSGRHLRSLVSEAQDKGMFAIIRTVYDPGDAGEWLSRKTGIPVEVLPHTVGSAEGTDDLFSLFDRIVENLGKLAGARR